MPRTRGGRALQLLALAARLAAVSARAAGLYARLRLRLWLWRRLSAWRFSRAIRGLPPGLREELEGLYREALEPLRLPGLGSLAGRRARRLAARGVRRRGRG
ncbi:MAG: hypothetical protein LRS49_06385 [Desulfurococcales archaeon]|nr:hypothetical protein [Desulfurococcales archaeon]